MVAVLSSKPTHLNLSYQDVTLAFQDGNWTRLCEEGSECVHRLLAVTWKASLSLTSKDGKITLTFSTPLGHLSAPLKSPPAPRPKALFPGPPASEPSASGPPYRFPTAAGRTSSYWTSCSRISTSWTSSSWTPSLTAASMGASPAKEGLMKGKPQLTQKLHRCCRLCKLFQNKISRATL